MKIALVITICGMMGVAQFCGPGITHNDWNLKQKTNVCTKVIIIAEVAENYMRCYRICPPNNLKTKK